MYNNIFMKPDNSQLIEINFSDTSIGGSEKNKKMIEIDFSDTIPIKQSGGNNTNPDTSEYFNRIADAIVNKINNQSGGKPKIDDLTSETINFIMGNESIDKMANINNNILNGGGKSKSKSTFDFESLKTYLKTSESPTSIGGSGQSESDAPIFIDDTFYTSSSDEGKQIEKLLDSSSLTDDTAKKQLFGPKSKKAQKKAKSDKSSDSSENDLYDDDDDEEDEEDEDEDLLNDDDIKKILEVESNDFKNKVEKVKIPGTKKSTKLPDNFVPLSETSSSSLSSTGGKNGRNDVSESISSPRLISYRKINTKRDARMDL